MSTRPLERICPSLPNSAKSVLLPVPPLRMGTPSRMMSGWLFPVMDVSPRTLIDTAPAEPPCVCVMRMPGALPYMADAKLVAPAFTISSDSIVLTA